MKERLDIILTKKGMFPSREKAKASIMAGVVLVDGVIVDKAGATVSDDAVIEIKSNPCPYVSRGGLKLEKALDEFHIDIRDAVTVDMGASTGGFTDCMLQRGAKRVYSIDVGYGQLDYKLRTDPRVVNIEKTNIRYMDTDMIKDPADLVTMDLSFISIKLVLAIAGKVLSPEGRILALIKPQFEAGKEQVGKGGIVRDKKIHRQVINGIIDFASTLSLYPAGITFSPVKGAKGNIEYLLLLARGPQETTSLDTEKIINDAHEALD